MLGLNGALSYGYRYLTYAVLYYFVRNVREGMFSLFLSVHRGMPTNMDQGGTPPTRQGVYPPPPTRQGPSRGYLPPDMAHWTRQGGYPPPDRGYTPTLPVPLDREVYSPPDRGRLSCTTHFQIILEIF